MKRVVLLFFCLSCTREKPSPTVETTATTSAAPTASASAAPAVVDPAVIAKRWNDALNTSDMTALASLYADKVKYYGVSFDRAVLVKRVADTLAKKPYHQEIKDVSHWHAKNGIRVQFHKYFGSRKENGGYLILDEKTLLVTEESDMTTDDTLLLAGKCIPYNQTVTVTGELSHATGSPNDDFWVIGLDKRVCLMDEDGGARSVCELPETLGASPLRESVQYSFTGTFGPPFRHQECSFGVTSSHAIPTTPK